MRYSLIVSLVAVLALAMGCTQEKTSFGLVDTNKVFQDSKYGKAAVTYLEEYQKAMQDELTALEKSLEQDPTNASLRVRYQAVYLSFQKYMNDEQQRIAETFNSQLQKALDDYRVEKKLTLLLTHDVVLASDKSVDVTSDFIASFNTKSADFTANKVSDTIRALSDGAQSHVPADLQYPGQAAPAEKAAVAPADKKESKADAKAEEKPAKK